MLGTKYTIIMAYNEHNTITHTKALVPNKQKQERTHKKLQLSSTFTCVTCSTKSPYVNRGKVAPCAQVAHNSCTSWSQAAHKLYTNGTQLVHKVHTKLHTPPDVQVDHKLHTKLHTSCTQLVHKLITSCTLFRFISVPSCCTRWLLNRFGTYTHNTQELTYKHRRWKKHTHISVNTPNKSFTFPYYNTEVFIDTQCSFHSWCLVTASSGMDTC